MDEKSYDLVVVGTGFASSFFLHRFLQKQPVTLKVLVLEAGPRRTHSDHLDTRDTANHPTSKQSLAEGFTNLTPEKIWVFSRTFGGGSNCWWACTPRLLPEDFRLRSIYGIGEDWPLDYDELETYYCDAEDLMNVSGDSNETPYPRSRPYPQPPHRMTEPDKVLKRAFPGMIFSHPCARSPLPVQNQRPSCCNNGVCGTCPIDAKFTMLNGMQGTFSDERVEILYNSKALQVEQNGSVATGVVFSRGGREYTVRCNLVVLGANALFNPYLMMSSGFDHPELGKGLTEQVAASVWIDLDGLDNFQGSTVSTALGYMCYGGESRRKKASALIQTINIPEIRNERGKWRQGLRLNFIFEDLRLPANHVGIDPGNPEVPCTTFTGYSDFAKRGLEGMKEEVERVIAPLPVERYEIGEPARTESHIMGTTVMGNDPESSIVDRFGIHHTCRNLIVLGSGLFPTAAPANPTLTLSALSLRCADKLIS